MYIDFKEIIRTISRITWLNCLTDLTFEDFWGVSEFLISLRTIIHILVLKNVEYYFAFRWLSNKFITNKHNQISLFIVMAQVKKEFLITSFFVLDALKVVPFYVIKKDGELSKHGLLTKVVKGNSPHKTQHEAITVML